MMRRRPGPALFVAVLAAIVGALSASELSARVRWVDIVTLFGSGFGAGAGVVAAVMRWRAGRPVG